MNQLKKYARFLVQGCLKLKPNQPLLIVGNTLTSSFAKLVREEAELMGGEVFELLFDKFQEKELYQTLSMEELLNHPMMDRSLYNDIAKQNGAFLSLESPIPHLFDDIDVTLLGRVRKELEHRISYFRERQEKGDLAWCIAAVSNEYWAKEILPNQENGLESLWKIILDICHMDEEKPEDYWNEYFSILEHRSKILNDLGICSLHFQSDNGTDITFDLPEHYLFQSAKGGEYIVNMPSLEVFTTPSKYGVNGIVKSTKPLYYSGVEIRDFWIRFEQGKVVEFDAKQNKDLLEEIIETDEGSHYLGELSLVDFDSKINQSSILFQTTLYDENACCHLALGRGFPECFQNGFSFSLEELETMGMNHSNTHVDFMIGSRDLEVIAHLKDGTDIVLMKHGKLIF